MAGDSKLDMSLDDLIKKTKKPAAKAKAKPGQQKGAQQQGKQAKPGVKGKVGAQQQQKKGIPLKAKGGVAKPGAGARPGAGKQQQQRPDVRVVPRPRLAPGGPRPAVGGPRPAFGGPRAAIIGRRAAAAGAPPTRFMGRGPLPMQGVPPGAYVGGHGMMAGPGMHMAAPMPAMQHPQAAAPPAQAKWQNDLFGDGSLVSSSASAKLLISNLDFKVSDDDIKELFGTVGAIKESYLHYDKSGRSLGTATVVFEKRSDALSAFNRYNNVALDNKKMSIEVVEQAVPRGTFKTLSSGINVSRHAAAGAAQGAGGAAAGAFRGRGLPQGDFMQE